MASREELKKWFSSGETPSEAQFYDWIDSFFHKNFEEDGITQDEVSQNIAIGMTPNERAKLLVNGEIESATNGFRFPDGSIQKYSAVKKGWLYFSFMPIYQSLKNGSPTLFSNNSRVVTRNLESETMASSGGSFLFDLQVPKYVKNINSIRFIFEKIDFTPGSGSSILFSEIVLYKRKLDIDYPGGPRSKESVLFKLTNKGVPLQDGFFSIGKKDLNIAVDPSIEVYSLKIVVTILKNNIQNNKSHILAFDGIGVDVS